MKQAFIVLHRSLMAAGVVGIYLLSPMASAQKEALTLHQAVMQALSQDIWHQGNTLLSQAQLDESVAAGQLPDPKIHFSLSNLPTDGFRFNQEGMTQLKVGLSQRFPRGETLHLKQREGLQQSGLTELMAAQRKANITRWVGQHYLDAYLAQQTIGLIEQSRNLFKQLADTTQIDYESVYGKAKQHDVIRAELELAQLDERLTRQWQQYEADMQQLTQWLPNLALFGSLATTMPNITPLIPLHTLADSPPLSVLVNHPLMRVVEQKRAIAQTHVSLAHQRYKPEWGVSASYSYRDDTPDGRSRADLFSIGVSVDVPLFTQKRQDKRASAAGYRAEAIETERQLLLRQLKAEFDATLRELTRLDERDSRYQKHLLVQSRQMAESALAAYAVDSGALSEVIRAYIVVLNTEINALHIQIEKQKQILTLNYLLAGERY